MTDERCCRVCGVLELPASDDNGDPVCWMEDDLCSECADSEQHQLEQDAARYRFLRNRQVRPVDLAAGGPFVGLAPDRVINGEHLDRAIDALLGTSIADVEPLELRLARCLAETIDTPLLSGRDEVGGFSSPLEIRLGFFKPEISERAASLLEEAGL